MPKTTFVDALEDSSNAVQNCMDELKNILFLSVLCETGPKTSLRAIAEAVLSLDVAATALKTLRETLPASSAETVYVPEAQSDTPEVPVPLESSHDDVELLSWHNDLQAKKADELESPHPKLRYEVGKKELDVLAKWRTEYRLDQNTIKAWMERATAMAPRMIRNLTFYDKFFLDFRDAEQTTNVPT